MMIMILIMIISLAGQAGYSKQQITRKVAAPARSRCLSLSLSIYLSLSLYTYTHILVSLALSRHACMQRMSRLPAPGPVPVPGLGPRPGSRSGSRSGSRFGFGSGSEERIVRIHHPQDMLRLLALSDFPT